MYVDVHCHLDKCYYDNIDTIITNASNNGVNKLIYNGCNLETNKEVIELVNKYDLVYGAIGFHPNDLININDEDYIFLEDNIKHKKIVAIGEIGLDYHYEDTDKELQKKHFIRQLELAIKYDLPVIVHSRDSIQETYDILKKYPVRGVLHCYSGSLEMAREFIKLGFFLSVGGIVTFKNAKNIIEVIKNIDLSYILLETDSPYLTPEPYRKLKNEPMYIPVIANKIAEIKGVNIEIVKSVTTDNALGLFDFWFKSW